MDNSRKVALVTGGAKGIGLEIARTLRGEGWRIALADRDTAALETATRKIGEGTFPLAVDIADVAAVRAGVDGVSAHFGRLDCLVNNAGVFRNEPLLDVEESTYDWIMDINLKGAFFCLQAAAKAMRAAGNGGTIVNIASAAGRSGRPTQTVYGMSKAGMIHLTKSAAMALAPDIRVFVVCPAVIETDMLTETLRQRRAVGGEADVQALMARIPLGRAGTPGEVADVVAWLASEKSSFMTGNAIDVSGGMEMP